MPLTAQDLFQRPDRLARLFFDLVRVPSVTGTPEERLAAEYIRDRLAEEDYFQDHPDHLHWNEVRLPEAAEPFCSVAALVKAARPTRRTVIFIGHFDVVDAAAYGGLADAAYEPERLAARLAGRDLPAAARRDLESGEYVFGRGVMDMKLGLALEMDLMVEAARNPDRFGVNLIMAAVGDEENNNTGMRTVVPVLASMLEKHDLDPVAVVDTEPSDPGRPDADHPVVFLGAMGKMLPFFYFVGRPTHVGNYFQGFSAALLASHVHLAVEANPDLAETARGETAAPPCCLGHELRTPAYSVTVPDRAVSYYNLLTLTRPPSAILEKLLDLARDAAGRAADHLERCRDGWAGTTSGGGRSEVAVLTYQDLLDRARSRRPDVGAEIDRAAAELPADMDLREKGIRLVERVIEAAGLAGPAIVAGFLPPFLPVRSSLGDSDKERALRTAAERLIRRAAEAHQTAIEKAVWFGGICDLSYAGSDFDPAELDAAARNTPGWGPVYALPLADMAAIDAPVVNIGPQGRDAHKMTERLETDFAFRVLPDLIRGFIDDLA